VSVGWVVTAQVNPDLTLAARSPLVGPLFWAAGSEGDGLQKLTQRLGKEILPCYIRL